MTLLIFTERVIAVCFLLWLGWLFTFNPEPVDGFDFLLGGLTVFSIADNYFKSRKIVVNQNERLIYGKTWRIIINAGALVAITIFLPPKLIPGDISAILILWLLIIALLYDLGLRIKAWQMLRRSIDNSSTESKG